MSLDVNAYLAGGMEAMHAAQYKDDLLYDMAVFLQHLVEQDLLVREDRPLAILILRTALDDPEYLSDEVPVEE